jgi:hypothetical protein
MSVPEVFYGMNHLLIAKPDRNILLQFSPINALSLSAFKKREEYLKPKGENL